MESWLTYNGQFKDHEPEKGRPWADCIICLPPLRRLYRICFSEFAAKLNRKDFPIFWTLVKWKIISMIQSENDKSIACIPCNIIYKIKWNPWKPACIWAKQHWKGYNFTFASITNLPSYYMRCWLEMKRIYAPKA